MHDVIIIGAGIGGLTCGAKLANMGKKVLILEKIHHIGGTSYIFKRKGYYFPMGPLSFSFPDLVQKILKEVGVQQKIDFQRNDFQLISPHLNIIYSKPLDILETSLIKSYPEEKNGLNAFFNEIKTVIDAIGQVHEWHPEFMVGKRKQQAEKTYLTNHSREIELIKKYSETSSKEILDACISDDSLKRLLGSQGTYTPVMSMVHLAFMWNVMSVKGIWNPSCGIYGINDLIYDSFQRNSGEIKLNTAVKEILVEKDRIIGVITNNDEIFKSNWLVANADYKKVFLELISLENVPKNHLEVVRNTPYTGSELCVYLGLNPNRVDLKNLRGTHIFYRDKIIKSEQKDPSDFSNKEIEICLWSKKAPDSVPTGKISMLLRVNMAYDQFSDMRVGYKKRISSYIEYKKELALKLINVVEKIIPGISSAVEVKEIATPLTYQDWGQRYRGSIAGWSRHMKKVSLFKKKLLINSPIQHLLFVGIYSVLEPFLGGFPVSMYTGSLAADLILEN